MLRTTPDVQTPAWELKMSRQGHDLKKMNKDHPQFDPLPTAYQNGEIQSTFFSIRQLGKLQITAVIFNE